MISAMLISSREFKEADVQNGPDGLCQPERPAIDHELVSETLAASRGKRTTSIG
jgi:hypothetical protein